MKKFMLGLMVVLIFQVCTVELTEFDEVAAEAVDDETVEDEIVEDEVVDEIDDGDDFPVLEDFDLQLNFFAGYLLTEQQTNVLADNIDVVNLGFGKDDVYLNGVRHISHLEMAKIVKAKNPDAILLGYRQAMGAHEIYEDWSAMNANEDWFVRNKYGHRIRQRNYCWYLMDVGNPGYREHIVQDMRRLIKETPYDGIFNDDVVIDVNPDWYYAYVEEEVATVSSDGYSVITDFPVYDFPSSSCDTYYDRISVHTGQGRAGENFFGSVTSGSKQIKLKSPLAAGSTVYLNYAAKEVKNGKPQPSDLDIPQSVRSGWYNDLKGYAQHVASGLGNEYLYVINSNDRGEIAKVTDGVMMEGWIHAMWHDDSYFPPVDGNYLPWRGQVEELIEMQKINSMVVVMSGTNTTNAVMRERTMRYLTGSFMLATDGTSSFSFQGCHSPERQGCDSRINIYPEWNMKLGKPLEKYFERENQIFARDFTNGYVLVNPSTTAQTVSLPEAMFDVNGTRMTSVRLEAHDGILLTKQ